MHCALELALFNCIEREMAPFSSAQSIPCLLFAFSGTMDITSGIGDLRERKSGTGAISITLLVL
eukprot:311011-Ditylum_brightwellii.AAC.1